MPHALTTNATKSGALSQPGDRVSGQWMLAAEPAAMLSIEWEETGGICGRPTNPTRSCPRAGRQSRPRVCGKWRPQRNRDAGNARIDWLILARVQGTRIRPLISVEQPSILPQKETQSQFGAIPAVQETPKMGDGSALHHLHLSYQSDDAARHSGWDVHGSGESHVRFKTYVVGHWGSCSTRHWARQLSIGAVAKLPVNEELCRQLEFELSKCGWAARKQRGTLR